MKTVKTATGIKKITEEDDHYVSLQLRSILEEHRSLLIDKMMSRLLQYVDYKFNVKPDLKQLDRMKYMLTELKNSEISLQTYQPLFETVSRHEHTHIGNALFYEEIDALLKSNLTVSEVFQRDGRKGIFQ